MQLSVITENNELSVGWLPAADHSGNVLIAAIDSGVSELCCLDDEVTCDVCSVVHFNNVEFLLVVDTTVTIIYVDAWCACCHVVMSTLGVAVPCNIRPINFGITYTSQRHLGSSYHCCVQRTTNQCGFYGCTNIINLHVAWNIKNRFVGRHGVGVN